MQNLVSAIFGFEILVLSLFIAYTIFPGFKDCIIKGINIFVKWSGFIALCISVSTLLINLMFNSNISSKVSINHITSWQLLLAIGFNLFAFDLRLRSFFSLVLIALFSIKAYFFNTSIGDQIVFTALTISFLNSLFSDLNKFSPNFTVQSILSLAVLLLSLAAFLSSSKILFALFTSVRVCGRGF